jgi:hypothetical protein
MANRFLRRGGQQGFKHSRGFMRLFSPLFWLAEAGLQVYPWASGAEAKKGTKGRIRAQKFLYPSEPPTAGLDSHSKFRRCLSLNSGFLP